jgi:hypothetical protein
VTLVSRQLERTVGILTNICFILFVNNLQIKILFSNHKLLEEFELVAFEIVGNSSLLSGKVRLLCGAFALKIR